MRGEENRVSNEREWTAPRCRRTDVALNVESSSTKPPLRNDFHDRPGPNFDNIRHVVTETKEKVLRKDALKAAFAHHNGSNSLCAPQLRFLVSETPPFRRCPVLRRTPLDHIRHERARRRRAGSYIMHERSGRADGWHSHLSHRSELPRSTSGTPANQPAVTSPILDASNLVNGLPTLTRRPNANPTKAQARSSTSLLCLAPLRSIPASARRPALYLRTVRA